MAILIYDENCPYCHAIAIGASKLSDTEKLEYSSDDAQKMLDKEFKDPGFTLYLFDSDKVYWGKEAARRTAEKMVLPYLMLQPAVIFYPYLVKLFSVLSGRNGVGQPACDSDRCMKTEKGGGMKKLKKEEKDLLELGS